MNLEIRTEDAPLKVGDEFLKYEIRALLGHGDHAFVYEAFDPMLERPVAIKLIPDPPNSRRDLAPRALEQAPILRGLNHPNLVSVYDMGTIGDELVYIVMERLVGRSLRELLNESHTLPVSDVLSIGIQVANGMGWAHSQEVIHRDLKPENVFITDNRAIKVMNTGITSFIVPSGMTTEWDCVRGTLLYMSPEHLQGFGVTGKSDIFSLGALLYECLVGTPPALTGAEPTTLDDIAWRQISQMPPLLSEVLPTVPEVVARLIQQMLAKEAALRFDSMETVAVSLQEVHRRVVRESSPKTDEPRPYVVFPSTAVGMKPSRPREKPASIESVLAGAELLVRAPGRLSALGTRGATRTPGHWYLVALMLGLIALLGWVLLRGRLSRTAADTASTAIPGAAPMPEDATDPKAAPATNPAVLGVSARLPASESSPSWNKNQKTSNSYELGRSSGTASAAPEPAPVIKSTTRPRGPRSSASAAGPSELVF